MTRFKAALLSGALVSAISVSAPFLSSARADETPVGGADDSRMRYIAYDAGQVVHLSTTVGSTLVVGFSPTETVSTAAEKCAIWRRKSVPVGLIKKGLEALLIDARCEPRGA